MSSYEYDLRSRLLKEVKKDKTSEETYVYRYDFNGNQLQRLWEKFETGKGRTEPGRVSFAKKKAGEVVICERRAYNGLGQLTSLYQDGEVTRYRYRPDGLRLCKEKADGSETGHIWDGSEMVAEYQANGTIIARYLRGLGLIARELDGQQEYYLHNAHGDVVQRTDWYGTPLKSYDYDAFGNEEKPEELDHNPWRYCGEYLDLEAQNYYLRARCYEPRTGRFTQQDSVACTTTKLPNGAEAVDPLSLNLYTYCGNNPVMFADPSGNFAIVDDLAYLGVGIGLIALAGIAAVSTLSSTGSLRSAWNQGVSNFTNNAKALWQWAQKLWDAANKKINSLKSSGATASANPDPDDSDPNDPDNKHSLKKINGNKEANKAAQKNGYNSAEDLKYDFVGKDGAKFNMTRDTKTGEIILKSIRGNIKVPTGLFN